MTIFTIPSAVSRRNKSSFLRFLGILVVFVGLSVWGARGQYSGTGTFTQITSLTDLTDGYYVIAYGTTFAMNNTLNASTYFQNTAITPSSNVITNPSSTIVWKIQTNATYGGRTIYSENSSKYVSYTGSSNTANAVASVTAGSECWTFAWSSSVFTITNITSTTRLLQYNTGSPRFACYTGSQQNITLYKMVLAPPTLTADASNNDIDNNIDIPFTDNATWRAAITAVKVGGTALTATTDYTITAGNIQLKPSGGNTLLKTSGTKTVTVEATGYSTATVTQVINAGAANKLIMKTQPTAPASNGAALAAQPAVYIQDQFGNVTTSTATIVASIGAGSWTLGGTTSLAATNGTATYSGLKATSLASVTGATISFASTGLTGITSNTFNIAAPTISLTAATGATVDTPFDVTCTDNSSWKSAITSITVGGTTLSASAYSVAAGKITFTPSLSTLLQTPGSKNIVVIANGYSNATVTQSIAVGTPTTNSTASISAVLAPGMTRTVTCTAKDQYNNLVTGYTFKYEVVITNDNLSINESYTLDGTARTASINDLSVVGTTNASGVATFTATLPASIDNNDGISIQVKLNNGTTNIGSAFSFAQTQSPQTITFDALSAKTYGESNFDLTASSTSNLTVSFASSNTAVATVSGNTVTIVGQGSTNITASQSGDVTYSAAENVVRAFVVNAKTLTLPDAVAQNKTYNGSNAAVITGTLTGIINSDAVTLSGTGTFADVNVADGIAVTSTCLLTGAKAGNYTLTQPTGLTANITKASQTITFSALTSKLDSDAPFSLTATASSSLTVSYSSSNTSVATISGNMVTIISAGSTDITASQSGNGNYNVAPNVIKTLTVNAGPIITWSPTGISSYGTSPWSSTTVNSNLTVGGLTRGSGLGTSGTAASDAWGGSMNTANVATSTAAITANQFVTFTVTPKTNYGVNLSTLDLYYRKSATGPASGLLQYAIDAGAYIDISTLSFGTSGSSTNGALSQINLSSVSSLQSVSSAKVIKFRIVLYGNGALNGTWYVYSTGLYIGGTVANAVPPTVTTSNISFISSNSATSGGNVTADGGASITDKGICWSTSANPEITDANVSGNSGKGIFISVLELLNPSTLYHVRAYATNSVGTAYGEDRSFTTLASYTLTFDKTGNGSVPNSGSYDAGSLTVSATADAGNRFVNWTDGSGAFVSTANPYQFTVSADRTLVANFADFTTTISAATYASTMANCPTCNITVNNGGEFTNDGTADRTYNTISVAGGGKLTNPSGSTLRLTALTLNSDGNGTGTYVDKGTSVITSASVNQTLGTDRNWYLSSPISAAGLPGADNIYYYDETVVSAVPNDSWKTPTGTLTVGKGYIVNPTSSVYDKITFNGALNSGDQAAVTLTRTTAKSSSVGFNLVGNPYPSYLNANALLNDASNTNVLKTIWYRTNNGSGWSYPTFNAEVVIGVPTNNLGLIPPMQAFWIRAIDDNVSFYFKNEMRIHNTSGSSIPFKAPAVAANQILRLKVVSGSNYDEAVVYFNPNAATGYDTYDSPKMMNGSTSLVPDMFTMVGTEQLIINGMNSIPTEIPLYIKANAATASQFSLSATEINNFEADTKVYVKNNKTGEQKLISDGTVYTFAASTIAGTDPALSVIIKAPGTVTDLATDNSAMLNVYANASGQITVTTHSFNLNSESSATVYNAIGQKLVYKQLKSTHTLIDMPYSAGVYVVTVLNNGEKITRKVILN